MRKGNAVLLVGRTAFFVRIPSGRHTVFGLFDMRQPAVSRGVSWRFRDFSCRSIPFAPLSAAGIPKPFRMETLRRTADFFRGLPEGEGNRVKNIWSGSEVKNDGPVGSRRYFRYFYGSAKKRGGSRGGEGLRLPRGGPSRSNAGDVMLFFARTDDRTDPNRI